MPNARRADTYRFGWAIFQIVVPDGGAHVERDPKALGGCKHVGLATGLAGALSSPDKVVASGLVIVGWAYDNMTTYIDRRMKKGDEDNAD